MASTASEVNNDKSTRVKLFKTIFPSLLTLMEESIDKFIQGSLFTKTKFKDLDSNQIKHIKKTLLAYKRAYKIDDEGSDEEMERCQLYSFKRIWLDNESQIEHCLVESNAKWLRDNDVILKYWPEGGSSASEKILVNISDIYEMTIKLKETHEKKMRDYPDDIKPDAVLNYPIFMEYYIYKIFNIMITNENLQKRIKEIETKASGGASARKSRTQTPDVSAIIDVGVDLFTKFQPDSKMDPKAVKGVMNNVLNPQKMEKIMSSINPKPGERPDIAQIFTTLMSNFDPKQLAETLKSAEKAVVPETPGQASPPEVPQKSVTTTIEEVIEEEITEEIISEPSEPSEPPKPSEPEEKK